MSQRDSKDISLSVSTSVKNKEKEKQWSPPNRQDQMENVWGGTLIDIS